MVTQPKSMATVVVVFRPVRGPSISTEAAVMSASVVSGTISEMAPTVVVLPTPNPPKMMIFTGTGGAPGARRTGCETPALAASRSGDRTKSTDHSQNGVGIGSRVQRCVDREVAGRTQIADEDSR